MTLSDKIADVAAGFDHRDVPDEVVATADRRFGAVLVVARDHDAATEVRAILELARTNGAGKQATVYALGERTEVTWAAFANGCAASSPRSVEARIAAAVAMSAAAAAEQSGAGVDALLDGVLVGLEVAARLRDALGLSHVARGWDLVGSAGRMGAAVAASRTLSLTPAQVHAALGYAATASTGVAVPGDSLELLCGKAASDGLEAAFLAASGLIGPPQPIEGRRGLLALVSSGHGGDQAFHGLGESWRLLDDWRESDSTPLATDLMAADPFRLLAPAR